MPTPKALMLAALLGAGLAGPLAAENHAAATDVTAGTVVATVGGTDITIGHMIAMLGALPQDQRQLPLPVLFEGILERLIQQEAISQSQDTVARLTELQLENERRALIASDVVNALAVEIEVSPEEVQAAYDRRFADFTPPTEYNASHILVETEDEAKALVAELEAGADFAELAMARSTGPSGPNGGQLGWFGPGRMVPPFEAAVTALEKGQISAPVQTQFGWHVIILNDTREPGVPTLGEMQGELEQEVWSEKLRAEITALVEAAEIDRMDLSGIDPQVLLNPGLVEN